MHDRRRTVLKILLPAVALFAAGVACGVLAIAMFEHRGARTVTATFDPTYPEHNGNGDPIRAVMEGRVACPVPGCDRLKVCLVLYETTAEKKPSTYWLGVVGTKGNERVVTRGTWQVQRGVVGYPDALVYALDTDTGLGLRYFWSVNDNILLQLDERMNPHAESGAWGHMLTRYSAPYGPRTYTWTP
jgi:hypothetical protein